MKFKAIALIWLPAIGSLPARGAWIEIYDLTDMELIIEVAPRTGSVD